MTDSQNQGAATPTGKIRIGLINGTTREGRLSSAIANWAVSQIEKDDRFEVTYLDLAEINLPFMDEPNHPRMQKYTQEHTKAWSQQIASLDAFIMMTAEYNHSVPAPLKNALDYLYNEWVNKPVSILSYGGVSAGLRAAEHLQVILNTLCMKPTQNAISIPFHFQRIDAEGFHATDIEANSLNNVLDELASWDMVLRPLRG